MHRLVACFLAFLLAALPCIAQQPAPASPLLVPAGTVLSIVLTQQISSSETRSGSQLHAQLVSPVVSGSQVALPAGTYLEGRVSRIIQQGDRVQVVLQPASLAFVDGYVAQLSGVVTVQSSNGWWLPSPSSHRAAALLPFLFAPGIGAGIGAAAGKDATLTPGSISGGQITPPSVTPSTRGRDAVIGFGVGAGIMAVGLAIYFASRHHGAPDFFFPAGAPMQATLALALSLDPAQVADAAAQPQPPVQPIVQRPQPPTFANSASSAICFAPDTPATPDTVIPGTPAIGDSPGTPNIVIPGRPAIPGPVIPCP